MGRGGDKRLIKSIQAATDVRLVLPFGLRLGVGDVVSVDRDGNLSLEASVPSVLGMDIGTPRPPSEAGDLYKIHGDGSACTFRASGHVSSLFPDAGPMSAGFDLHFKSAEGWLLAVTGRQLTSLDETNRFRAPILAAHARKVWRPDWVLVTEVATAQRITLLAARMAKTNIALTAGIEAIAAGAMALGLTAEVSVSRASQEITQWVRSSPAVMGFRGLRVRDRWWRDADVGTLETVESVGADAAMTASDAEFWQDLDEVSS